MRKLAKAIRWALVILAVAVTAGILAVYAFVLERPAALPREEAGMKPHQWYKLVPDGPVRSGDGSGYYGLLRKGESRNWMLFFSGGGVSPDGDSAARPIRLRNMLLGRPLGYYFANIPFFKLNTLGGMLAADKPGNPFRDWNIVYLPYTTGDFHIGNREAHYERQDGSSFTMHYNGRNNVQAILDKAYATMDAPAKLLIAGESAGGFGSAFWAGEIASRFPDSEIYQLADSSFLYSDRWPQIVEQEWQADFGERFGFAPDADLIAAAYRHNARRLPSNAVLLQCYSLYDEVLISFQNHLNSRTPGTEPVDLAAWSRELRHSVQTLASDLPNYYYYLTDYGSDMETGMTGHTFVVGDAFYQTEEEDIRLLTWLDDAVNRGKPYSVGSRFLTE
ncbi:MAG: hypothetical protein K0R57_6664 [Paenibacillaceae bacterium]|jgi:hypothetical protein|nr:hypothetical protein [Paenibacillaceae bacterium]